MAATAADTADDTAAITACVAELEAAVAPLPHDSLRLSLEEKLSNLKEALSEDDDNWARTTPDERILRVALLGRPEAGPEAALRFFLRVSTDGHGHKSPMELITGHKQQRFPRHGRVHKTLVPCNGEERILLMRTTTTDPSPCALRWADAFFIFLDATDKSSLEQTAAIHAKMLQHRRAPGLPCMLVHALGVGGKEPVVTDDDLDRLAEQLGQLLAVVKVQPESGVGVDRIFHDIVHEIVENVVSDSQNARVGKLQQAVAAVKGGGSPIKRRDSEVAADDLGFGRSIPLKQGMLRKVAGRQNVRATHQKRWIALTSGTLTTYPSLSGYMSNAVGKSIDLSKSTVKQPRRPAGMASPGTPSAKERHGFSIVSLDGRSWQFEADSEAEQQQWISAIEAEIHASLNRNFSAGAKNAGQAPNKGGFYVLTPEMIAELHAVRGNARCADCGTAGPTWASLNLGVLLCIECSGIHRNIGVHISRVRSLELDDWRTLQVDIMKRIGNAQSNAIWEAALGTASKPTPTTDIETKAAYVRRKYQERAFLDPAAPSGAKAIFTAVQDDDIVAGLAALAATPPSEAVRVLPSEGSSAVHVAARSGNAVWLQLLLWHDPHCKSLRDTHGALPIDLLPAERQECVALLKDDDGAAPTPAAAPSAATPSSLHTPTASLARPGSGDAQQISPHHSGGPLAFPQLDEPVTVVEAVAAGDNAVRAATEREGLATAVTAAAAGASPAAVPPKVSTAASPAATAAAPTASTTATANPFAPEAVAVAPAGNPFAEGAGAVTVAGAVAGKSPSRSKQAASPGSSGRRRSLPPVPPTALVRPPSPPSINFFESAPQQHQSPSPNATAPANGIARQFTLTAEEEDRWEDCDSSV